MFDLSTEAHLARMTALRDHHGARMDRGYPTDDFHAEQVAYLNDYLSAAEADQARVTKQRREG